MTTQALQRFQRSLARPDLLDQLRAGLIGEQLRYTTPFGEQTLIYADYVASGRALRQVESFVLEEVLPVYSNTHTEASFCGQSIKRLREAARGEIARITRAGNDAHVIFAGAGATAGLNRIVGMLDIKARVAAGQRVKVLIGPYEHHSNILPWRESGAELEQLPLNEHGTLDLSALDQALAQSPSYDLVVGAFSAGSNVTGVLSDTRAITQRLKRAGALAIFDYAAVAPYVDIDMGEGEFAKDAIVFSTHKFPGGPGASGILVVRDTLDINATPSVPGGGTVAFVSPWHHRYVESLTAREEAGTPNVVGDIRAALVMLIKEAVGVERIEAREQTLRQQALEAWQSLAGLRLLSPDKQVAALPILSFQLLDAEGTPRNHQLVTRLLSDKFGIQARGGCACAGPYAHYLLGIDESSSQAIEQQLQEGNELAKPGWVRLNLSYLHSESQVAAILAAVAELATSSEPLFAQYQGERGSARFSFQARSDTPIDSEV
ncbi:aminotransferase class V-fold PLP-dependent enzyme [Carnimonas bestiolae]|uniref:aminotransferase class V-fold PLP-dependent enzyme n=1 Tax=Carnimonas bestiolae TaxID=3402172 RepID=UPI003EDC48E0